MTKPRKPKKRTNRLKFRRKALRRRKLKLSQPWRRKSRKHSRKMTPWELAEKKRRDEEFRAYEDSYTVPHADTEEEVEACRQRHAEGKKCYCQEICRCRSCQTNHKDYPCGENQLMDEGGCYLCHRCPERVPCW